MSGIYQVSNLGNIKSLDRWYKNAGCNGGFYHRKEKNLILVGDKNKYLKVTLCKSNKKKNESVHRLVAEAFIPNPDNLPQVNHKDENPENNKVDNLEWCTIEYNINYGNRTKRNAEAKYKSVLQYDSNGNFIKEWNSIKEALSTLKISNHISDCCNKKRKKCGGYIWKYKDKN